MSQRTRRTGWTLGILAAGATIAAAGYLLFRRRRPGADAGEPEEPEEPDVSEGALHGGLPDLRTGKGPPLVVLTGLSTEHQVPTGVDRQMDLRMVAPFTDHFTVHLLSRRPGLAATTTMADLASHVATAIRHDLGAPVPVLGISTGGSIAQQLAVDHPDLVERLLLVSTACRLGPEGREVQRRLADLTEEGRPRWAWAAVGPPTSASALGGWAMAAMMWLIGRARDPEDPSDMLATIRAEDAFDIGDRLHGITAPTLLVAGERDGFYTPELFRRTAEGIPGAELLLYPRKGHISVVSYQPAQEAMLRFLTEGRRGTADGES